MWVQFPFTKRVSNDPFSIEKIMGLQWVKYFKIIHCFFAPAFALLLCFSPCLLFHGGTIPNPRFTILALDEPHARRLRIRGIVINTHTQTDHPSHTPYTINLSIPPPQITLQLRPHQPSKHTIKPIDFHNSNTKLGYISLTINQTINYNSFTLKFQQIARKIRAKYHVNNHQQ